jgi:acyl-CoA reductase-like NAD-dependent aldehyde dehydrogenase
MASDQGLLIAGEQQESSTGETYDDINPYTGDAIATVAAASPADATRAVDAAAAAFKTWSQASPAERRAVFLRAAQLVKERTSDVIAAMTPETGATFGWGMFMVHLAEGMILEAAAAATAPVGEVNATNDPGALSLTIRRPAGVVAAFSPWNAPTYLSARAVGIPLAVGNTVVLKATEEAPISAGFFLAELLRDAGLPAGVLNVITTPAANAEAVSRTLIDDPRVRRVKLHRLHPRRAQGQRDGGQRDEARRPGTRRQELARRAGRRRPRLRRQGGCLLVVDQRRAGVHER